MQQEHRAATCTMKAIWRVVLRGWDRGVPPDCAYVTRLCDMVLTTVVFCGGCVFSWSEQVQARTKIEPKNGGGYTHEYVWEQTPTEVSIMFEVGARCARCC